MDKQQKDKNEKIEGIIYADEIPYFFLTPEAEERYFKQKLNKEEKYEDRR